MKQVKGWIIVSRENSGLEEVLTHKNYHVMSIFHTKKFALANLPKGYKYGNLWKVKKCIINVLD